jgi:UDP-N-acetylmuramyl pentapeptide synthase
MSGRINRLNAMAAQPGHGDDQRNAAEKLIEAAVEAVTAVKRSASHCRAYRQGRGMPDVMFFKADPALASTVAETLKAAPAVLQAVKDLQDAVADAAEAWNIEAACPHVT